LIVAILLSTAGIAAAKPIPTGSFPHYYPLAAMRKAGYANATFRLVVAPDGKAERCDITASSGSTEIDAAACLIISEPRFRPATDDQGNKVYGLSISRIHLVQNHDPSLPAQIPIGIDVALKALPPGMKALSIVNVNAVIDTRGAVEACEPEPPYDGNPLGEAACRQARQSWHPGPARDRNGQTVRSVERFPVFFHLAATPARL
jgi:TonB family protein